MTTLELLDYLAACDESIAWAEAQIGADDDHRALWFSCPNAEWLAWLTKGLMVAGVDEAIEAELRGAIEIGELPEATRDALTRAMDIGMCRLREGKRHDAAVKLAWESLANVETPRDNLVTAVDSFLGMTLEVDSWEAAVSASNSLEETYGDLPAAVAEQQAARFRARVRWEDVEAALRSVMAGFQAEEGDAEPEAPR